MDATGLIRRRLARQRLSSAPLGTAADVVSMLGAVQAQEYAEARWSLAERMRGEPSAAEIDAALESGEILRTHCLRPTWHFVARNDIRWILAATTHRVHATNKGAYRAHELDPNLIGRSQEVIAALLDDGEPRTRKEVAAELAGAGIEASGSRLAHIVMHAELDGLICSGPLRRRQHTYALISDRAPNAKTLPREDAIRELARRYFTGHGPASRADFCTWSSLTLADAEPALEALRGELAVRKEKGIEMFEAPSHAPRRTRAAEDALLLPMYDEMIMGYRDVRPTTYDPDQHVGHFERPIVVDGETIGTWRRVIGPAEVTVQIKPVAGLPRARLRAIEVTADRLGRHLGLPARVEILPFG